MKLFDLEAAKRGDPVCTTDGELRHFIGKRLSGNLVVEVPDTKQIYTTSDEFLRMAPKKRTVWVNFYCTGESRYYDEEAIADSSCGTCRIGDKAYPVEIEK